MNALFEAGTNNFESCLIWQLGEQWQHPQMFKGKIYSFNKCTD